VRERVLDLLRARGAAGGLWGRDGQAPQRREGDEGAEGRAGEGARVAGKLEGLDAGGEAAQRRNVRVRQPTARVRGDDAQGGQRGQRRERGEGAVVGVEVALEGEGGQRRQRGGDRGEVAGLQALRAVVKDEGEGLEVGEARAGLGEDGLELGLLGFGRGNKK